MNGVVEILHRSLHFPFALFSCRHVWQERWVTWYFCSTYSSLFVGCIVILDVYHTSEYCFSRTLIASPEGNRPNGNYFMENACVRFLFTSSEIAENERVSAANEWDF